jgi:hypothetical protein
MRDAAGFLRLFSRTREKSERRLTKVSGTGDYSDLRERRLQFAVARYQEIRDGWRTTTISLAIERSGRMMNVRDASLVLEPEEHKSFGGCLDADRTRASRSEPVGG